MISIARPQYAGRPASPARTIDTSPPDYALLRDYQKTGVDALREHRSFLLADEMRLGKSAQALRALPQRARAIVMCPKSAIGVWEDQISRWRPDLSAAPREAVRRPRAGEVLICSWDSLPAPPQGSIRLVLDDLSDVRLIADEVHYVMTESAQRTHRWRLLRAQCYGAHGLSGTPMPGAPMQLWGVLSSLGLQRVFDLGVTETVEGVERRLTPRDTFVGMCGGRKKFITNKRTGRLKQIGYEWGKVSPEVRELVGSVMLRRLAKDLHSLPPKQYQDVSVPPPEDLREFLDKVKSAWDSVGSDDMPPFEVLSEARAALARSRIPEAVEFAVEAAKSMPVVVFSAHVDPVLAFKGVPGAGFFVGDEASLAGEGEQGGRAGVIKRFQEGKIQILAMTIKVGGVGLDLSRADGILFVDQAWNPGDNLQAEARASAVGKTRPIMIWRMTSKHPIEVRLREIHEEKIRLQDAIGV